MFRPGKDKYRENREQWDFDWEKQQNKTIL
jgi:hypothetical protein